MEDEVHRRVLGGRRRGPFRERMQQRRAGRAGPQETGDHGQPTFNTFLRPCAIGHSLGEEGVNYGDPGEGSTAVIPNDVGA
jgi:hypothetical protein